MRVALDFNGYNKLEQKSFNNIVAMKTNVIFEFNISNSFSVGSNMEGRHQPGHCQILSKTLIEVARKPVTWQFKENLKESKKENIWVAVEKIRKGKR